MSRTEAHAPYWTYAAWWEPAHGLWCNRRYDCNLPKYPVRHAGRRPNRVTNLCTWEPVWPGWRETHKIFGSHVPNWYVDHVWHNPERVRERDLLGKMAKEYNATGGIEDDDFPCWQGRYSAWWGWD